MKSRRSVFIQIGILAAFFAALVVLWLQRWNLYDSWRLRGYTAPAAIASLASDTTMNDKTRRLFYAYRPELDSKDTFTQNCKSHERTIVLGCYISGKGIYVFNVQDERLNGVTQVTAAHEMLHAAYERLNPADKAKINSQITEAYKQITDKRIRDTISDYQKNGADTTNELHSILGTEVRDLPPELENYYRRYFNDRAVVVGYSEKYEQAFTERKNKVSQIDAQLDELKTKIDSNQNSLNTQSSALETERKRLEALLAAKNYSEYNAGVNGYNAQVSSYNALVRQVRSQIDEYNKLVADRNTIATEESELVKAIDSRPSTIDSQ